MLYSDKYMLHMDYSNYTHIKKSLVHQCVHYKNKEHFNVLCYLACFMVLRNDPLLLTNSKLNIFQYFCFKEIQRIPWNQSDKCGIPAGNPF